MAGRFEVVGVLGEGGMGVVYSVRDRQIEDRAMALKVLLPRFSDNPAFRRLFFKEIRAAQNFVCEHVVQLRDCGLMDDGRLFVTMDLVIGESLRDLLGREGALGTRHALEIARQVLLALQSGHERGFIHRDIKPANMMLCARVAKTDDNPFGVAVRVLDFGIAGLAAEIDERTRSGTPLYMSPEQIRGDRLDVRSDLFAVGVVLYEMLASRRPFAGKTLDEITHSVIETDVSARIAELDDLSTPIREILEKALQKDREKRFQSAAEFIAAIERSSAYRLPSLVPIWAWAALAIASLAASTVGYFLWESRGRVQWLEDQLRAEENKLTEYSGRVGLGASEQQTEVARLALALQQANSELAKLRSNQVATDAEEGDELTRLQAQLQDQQIALDNLTRDFEAAKFDKEGLSQKVNQLDQERARLQQQLDPNVRRAAAFDMVVTLLASNDVVQAQHEHQNALAGGDIERSALARSDVVAELIEAWQYVAQFASGDAGGEHRVAAALLAAADRLGVVRKLRETLPVTARGWLSSGAGESAMAERLARLDELIAALAARVDPELARLDAYHEEEWSEIVARGALRDPGAAFAHADTFRCGHLEQLLGECSADARATLERDGLLDLEALAAAAHLDAWGSRLAGDAAALTHPAARELMSYSYARRWYDADDGNDAGFDFSSLALPPVVAETPDWRAVLAVEYALAQPESAFPILPDRTLVYRYGPWSTEIRWRVEQVANGGPAEFPARWRVKRSYFKSDLTPLGVPSELSIVRRGARFFTEDSSEALLDLRAAGASVSVAPFPALDTALPPRQLRVNATSMDEHRRALAEAGPCLVVRTGASTRWYSPQFGLVLQSLPPERGAPPELQFELVFATPVR